ncbi:MAG: MerR family transcriptional regulator [Eubacteriales bacterium]|nr:MerR family transcriptional regulator [Eubacteriales bacterium]
MNISQLEAATGITKQNIRFYEKKGLLRPARNEENNYREYSAFDLETLKIIKVLRKLDVPIEEIREVLAGEERLPAVMERKLAELQERQRELDAGIEMCKNLLGTELENLNADRVLEQMEQEERKGGVFMSIVNDFKAVNRAEEKRSFSFAPAGEVCAPEDFTRELFRYADENHAHLVITKESMYPVFEMDGVEYTARREYRHLGAPFPVAVICCDMTSPEEADRETERISPARRFVMRFLVRYLAVLLIAAFLVLTARPLWLAALFVVAAGPFVYWNSRVR